MGPCGIDQQVVPSHSFKRFAINHRVYLQNICRQKGKRFVF